MKKLARLCLTMLFALSVANVAWSQPAQTGTIAGEIKDATGGALPGVSVTLTSEDRGFTRDTVTDGNGRFVFPAVPIGTYSVSAALQGFETSTSTRNLVESDKNTAVNFDLKIGSLTDVVQVIGDTPIVDPTTVTATTRISREEFDKLPVARSYLNLIAAAPGVVGSSNVNSAGALSSNNLYIIDAVDTTDPTTGTFGTNLNFEAVQEVTVLTSAVGAEYGRAQGAVVNVVTKSGTNRFEGAFKYIFNNDQWNAQNDTTNEVTGASLARTKFDHVNPIYSLAGGGPIWRNHAFFFATWERDERISPLQQTAGAVPEEFQSNRVLTYSNYRGTVQPAEGHTIWVKYFETPDKGIVRNDYWGTTITGDREALTAQDQAAENWAAQWSGVIRNNWSIEAAGAKYSSRIDVGTFELGVLGGAPIESLEDGKVYNGATFTGFVERPREQFNIASNWFLTFGARAHNIKVGYDFQNMESGSQFDYPNKQYYVAESFNPVTQTPVFGPNSSRLDFDSGASVSTGKINALYARDKMQLTGRMTLEAGLRWERQTGASDVGLSTVDASTLAPRLSGAYDLTGEGKSLIIGSYGRYYQAVIQDFSDEFAQVAQQANYNNYVWNGTAFVFSNRVQVSGAGSGFEPNLDLRPSHMDEYTIGYQRQIGREMGASVRFISRTWGDLIDDVLTFSSSNSVVRDVQNYEPAERTYRGLQLTTEKRFSNNWSASASYTYSRTRGNHFLDTFTPLGDYLDAQCRTTADPTIGSNGVVPCSTAQNGANKYGAPAYDRPHNFKLGGAYVRPIGPVNLTMGAVTEALSKWRFQQERTLTVLLPGTTTNSGNTSTYYYNERGANSVDGTEWYVDTSFEGTWRFYSTAQAGFRAEIFNITNRQEKLRANNVVYCGSDSSAACTTARANFGTATSRGSFRGGLAGTLPRSYRFSMIFRF